MLTRRQFSKGLAAGGAALLIPESALAGRDPLQGQQQNSQTPKDLDLVIKGGTVVDPAQNLHSVLDVAVRDGKIAEVSKDIVASRARRVISAKDKIVTPGFIDIHVHCYDGAAGSGIDADRYCLAKGVTTVVDAGSSSSQNILNFRKYIIQRADCRIFALINIDSKALMNFFGPQVNSADVIAGMDVQAATLAVKQNRPVTVGIKTLLGQNVEGDKDVEALTRAVQAGQATGTPVLAHIDNTTSPLPDLLKLMRKGDVYSHCYNGHPHGILDANGKVLPEARDARQRGVLFDPAHGNSHFSFEVAEKCLAQDFPPDTISTDMNNVDIYQQVFDIPTMVSKFLALGMDLDKAIERVTANPAKVFDWGGISIGALKPGYEADIAISQLNDGNFEFTDSMRQMRTGKQMLVNKTVVIRGEVIENQTN